MFKSDNIYCCAYIIYLFCIGIETKKPSGSFQQSVWRLECELGVISDADCPVDGGWTAWGAWSPCRGTCDNVGHRRRARQCINPPPAKDGLPCAGADNEAEPCHITNCTARDYRKIVEGDAIRTDALRQLETVPALMEQCLQTDCPYEAIEAALISDDTWQINPEALWNSLLCVRRNIGCPVIGEWGTWGEWSACGARCGNGLKWRLRRCDTPPPSVAHLICSGTPLQADECQGDQCAINKRDSTGTWQGWGSWTPCSEKCGVGVRRRKRVCFETVRPRLFGSWGTHCRGQHDHLEVCEYKDCTLDGGWSGWAPWGPCSRSCGAGKRSRSRSCTRPIPAGTGIPCVGPRSEVSSCHLSPCDALSHTIAVFNGESMLQYNLENKRSALFHFYIRFLPLSPHGTLVRRGSVHKPLVRLSLQKWHLCLDANGLSHTCTVPRTCSHVPLEPAVWHSALLTVTSQADLLRIDDAPIPIISTFSCDPELIDEPVNIIIGEKFHGEIQELILNFIPLNMFIGNTHSNCHLCPTTGSNVAYEKAGIEEAFLTFRNEQYLRLPCFNHRNLRDWRIEITLRPKRKSGTIVFMQSKSKRNWLLLSIENMRLQLKLSLDDFKTESSSTTELPPDGWFDISLSKPQSTNSFEASINSGERIHVIFDPTLLLKRNAPDKLNLNFQQIKSNIGLCEDEYFIGGATAETRKEIAEDFSPFYGTIASIRVNDEILDIHTYNMERSQNDKIQVSSRTASVSGYYYETVWGKSKGLNLTCLHARSLRSPHTAHWFYLDTTVNSAFKGKTVRSIDDGRVLRLHVTPDNDLRGFYTCRAHSDGVTKNVVTYGLIGDIQHTLTGPDMTTAIAVVTTLSLVIGTLAWLFIEVIHDIRNGYGFFRDPHMTPEEEAEAVCEYIDRNIELVGGKSAANVAKAKARSIGKHLASRYNFGAQEPQGLMEIKHQNSDSLSEVEALPALPEIRSSGPLPCHNRLKSEQSYVSSPRHGSFSSPRTNMSSSSSFDTSPRVLCSRLVLAKRIHSSAIYPTKPYKTRNSLKAKSNLLTIKSSSYVNQSPAQKILQKFQQLKKDDDI